jgi:hypothetical protein
VKICECLRRYLCCCIKTPKLRHYPGIEQKVDEVARGHLSVKSGYVWGVKENPLP